MFPSALSIYSAIPSTHWSEKYQRSLMFAKCDYRCHWSCARPYKQCQGHRCVLLISPDGVTIIICFTHMEMLHSIASVNYLSFLFWSERSINSFRKLQFIQNFREKTSSLQILSGNNWTYFSRKSYLMQTVPKFFFIC